MSKNKRPKRTMPSRYTRPLRKKKTVLTRRVKKKEIEIVTRKEQPMPVQLKRMKVEVLAKQNIPMTSVSSSWIAKLGYSKDRTVAAMLTKQGYGYYIMNMDFNNFMLWYYAHSKGTFFNYHVKDKFKIVRYQ